MRYLNYYSTLVKTCCDPFQKHEKVIKSDLRIISVNMCEAYKKVFAKKLIPGEKLCRPCQTLVNKLTSESQKSSVKSETSPTEKKTDDHSIQCESLDHTADVRNSIVEIHLDNEINILEQLSLTENKRSTIQRQTVKRKIEDSASQENDSLESDPSSGSIYQTESQEIKSFDNLLMNSNVPPLKRQKLNSERLENAVVDLLVNVTYNVAEKVKSIYEVNVPEVKKTVTGNIFEDSRALLDIIVSLQARFETTKSVNDKINLLMLLPKNWKFSMIKQYFNCTRYMYGQLEMIRKDGMYLI